LVFRLYSHVSRKLFSTIMGFSMRHKKMDLSVKIPLFTGILVVVVLLYMIFAAGPSVEMIEKKDTIQPEAF
jgi:hypothetical protein